MALTVGLKALYHLNGDARDSSGNGNHGTVVGATVESETVKLGSAAYSFDGVDDRVSIPLLNFDEVSVAFWFNRSSLDSVNADTVFGAWKWSSDVQLQEGFDVGRFFQLSPNKCDFTIVTEDGGGVRSVKTVAHNVGDSTGSWTHLVATYSKSTGEQKLYIDGLLRDTTAHIAGNTIVHSTYFVDMWIGASRVNQGYFNGFIDEVALWDRPLSDGSVSVGEVAGGEVAESYNDGFGREIKLTPKGYVPRSVHKAIKVKAVKV
ncbi:MAG: LamG domain-containing protein [Deltaproteobacteria bacterium]|nr:LamG domain-containing protein [Deltaproteobacteria bacterium]